MQQKGWQTNFLRKDGQNMVLGTQALLTGGQAAADSVNDLVLSQEDNPQTLKTVR